MATKTKTNAIHLDPFTAKVLSNFATINNGIVIKSGSEIRTMTEGKTVLAEATVPDVFPVDFAIYDVRQLLSFMGSMFDNPSIEFFDNHLKISSGSDVTKIFYCNSDLVASPSKRITMPSEDITFQLSEDTLHRISKASSILSVDDLQFSSSDSDVVTIAVLDKTNSATNTWSSSTTGTFDKPFNVYLKIDNLKMLEGDYQVTISNKGITSFKNMRSDLKYFIAAEGDSRF